MNPSGIPQAVEKAELNLRLVVKRFRRRGAVIGSIEYESAGNPGNVATAAAGLTVHCITGFHAQHHH
jgi:hypothetical protein